MNNIEKAALYDKLAIDAYYSNNYRDALTFGGFALKNNLYDERLQTNMSYYLTKVFGEDYYDYDLDIRSYIASNFSNNITILDVGAEAGHWADLLTGLYSSIDAVEAYMPYIEQFNLKSKYNEIFNIDIRDYTSDKFYDLIILGDVLEHLSIEEAQTVYFFLKKHCQQLLVIVPYLYYQPEVNGNIFQKHIQDDLTHKKVMSRYPGLIDIFRNEYKGVYIKDNANIEKAYITLLSDNSFINGIVVLHKSLKLTNSKYPLYCIVTPDVSEENINVLKQLNIRVIEKDCVIPSSLTKKDSPDIIESLDVYGWHKALVKLNIFGLTQFKKLVYIDADMLVKQNIDELFDKPHMSACWDCFGFDTDEICESGSFNSGLLVVEPNAELFEDIMRFFNTFDGGGKLIHDQWVLQEYFKEWPELEHLHLDRWWAPWTTIFREDRDEFYYMQSKIKILHMIDRKPWRESKQYFIECAKNWPCYSKLCLDYIDILNYTIKDLNNKGISSSDLKIIN